MILLDTHIWIWMIGGVPRISKPAQSLLHSTNRDAEIYLSSISLWEIALKASRGHIEIGEPLRRWLPRAVERSRVRIIDISPAIAVECAELPPEFHGDPADRIIAATARNEGFTLITHDQRLLELGKRGFFRAVAS